MVAKLLNLRPEPKPIIIEKVIQSKRIWWLEILKMVTVITVVSSIVYGISKADITIPTSSVQSFSAFGTVSDMSPEVISIENARSSEKAGAVSYTFKLIDVKKIENRIHVALLMSDIHVGDKIVAMGMSNDGAVTINRIISFSSTATTSDVVAIPLTASTTATSTLEIATSTASTTSVVATSTATSTQSGSSVDISTTTASTTLEIATSTASTTPVVATSTATTTDITATTTPSSATSTDTTNISTTTSSGSTTPADPAVVPPAPVTPPDPAPVAPDPTPSN